MPEEQPMVLFKDVEKVYRGGNVAVEHINLEIHKGDFVCLIGTSGSGKTTTMRMINRMLEPSGGQILFNGKDIHKIDAVKLRRQIGYVIQNIGLMPHMTIYENITIVPKLLKWPEEKRREKAKELLDLVELPEDYLDRYPSELSGGQQQRIGVIRALAANQDLILMDEPYGALDPITREALQELIKNLQEKLGKTVVFVTHDMDEALKLATKIVVMDHGHIIQNSTPTELLTHPANKFVENLVGQDRLVQARADVTTVEQIMLKNPAAITPGKSLAEAILLIAFSNAGLNTSLLLMRIRNLSALSPEQPWSMLFTTLSGATTMTNLTITTVTKLIAIPKIPLQQLLLRKRLLTVTRLRRCDHVRISKRTWQRANHQDLGAALHFRHRTGSWRAGSRAAGHCADTFS